MDDLRPIRVASLDLARVHRDDRRPGKGVSMPIRSDPVFAAFAKLCGRIGATTATP